MYLQCILVFIDKHLFAEDSLLICKPRISRAICLHISDIISLYRYLRFKMPSARSVVVVFAFCVAVACGQTFETGDNSTVRGCSSHCRVDDPTLECWDKTLAFFERVLLGQLRHYIAVQINIDQWHRRHDHHYEMDFEKVKQNAIVSMEAHLEEEDLVNATTVEAVMGPMIDRVKDESSEEISWVPHFSCPLPCEHRSVVWRNLFIASMVLNVCLAIAVVPFIVQMVKHDNAHASESLIR
uniref:KASH domain-containing protein n=1 Tax=Steinernema glaseri TaxID=37863 RepID=A0A1I7YGN4_9BILA